MYLRFLTCSLLVGVGTVLAAPQGSDQWLPSPRKDVGDHVQNGQRGRLTESTTSAVLSTYGDDLGHGMQPTHITSISISTPPTSTANAGQAMGRVQPTQESVASYTPLASVGDNAAYMGVVSTWRSNMGLQPLTEDLQLVANAEQTARDGDGQMVHSLHPGSMGQVLAPGSSDEFEKVFVGGWLCEKPGMAGLDGVCNTLSAGWDYQGQTGHAEILTSPIYHNIGCGWVGGIWACDLA